MEYLISIDRESFQKKIDSLKNENKKCNDEIVALQESERELKRERKIKDLNLLRNNFRKTMTLILNFWR